MKQAAAAGSWAGQSQPRPSPRLPRPALPTRRRPMERRWLPFARFSRAALPRLALRARWKRGALRRQLGARSASRCKCRRCSRLSQQSQPLILHFDLPRSFQGGEPAPRSLCHGKSPIRARSPRPANVTMVAVRTIPPLAPEQPALGSNASSLVRRLRWLTMPRDRLEMVVQARTTKWMPRQYAVSASLSTVPQPA